MKVQSHSSLYHPSLTFEQTSQTIHKTRSLKKALHEPRTFTTGSKTLTKRPSVPRAHIHYDNMRNSCRETSKKTRIFLGKQATIPQGCTIWPRVTWSDRI